MMAWSLLYCVKRVEFVVATVGVAATAAVAGVTDLAGVVGVVAGATPVVRLVRVWLMLTNCCSELTSVSWLTMSSGLIGFVGSCACNSAVSKLMNRLESARPALASAFAVLVVPDVDIVGVVTADVSVDGRLLTCMFSPP
jgi:hypothetical protein